MQNSLPLASLALSHPSSHPPSGHQFSFTNSHSYGNPHTLEFSSHTGKEHKYQTASNRIKGGSTASYSCPEICTNVSMFWISGFKLEVSSQETLFSLKRHVRMNSPEEGKLVPTAERLQTNPSGMGGGGLSGKPREVGIACWEWT